MKKVRARNIELIFKYQRYRNAGLSYEEIRKHIKKDNRQFQRWNDYIKRGLFDLSTAS